MREKRRYHRVKKALPLKISHSEFDVVTETRDISGNGAYCSVNKPIAVMTKLRIVILIPVKKAELTSVKKVVCQGVVVRETVVEGDKKHPYHIGIFFNEISESDRKALTSYINSFPRSKTISQVSTPHLH